MIGGAASPADRRMDSGLMVGTLLPNTLQHIQHHVLMGPTSHALKGQHLHKHER